MVSWWVYGCSGTTRGSEGCGSPVGVSGLVYQVNMFDMLPCSRDETEPFILQCGTGGCVVFSFLPVNCDAVNALCVD